MRTFFGWTLVVIGALIGATTLDNLVAGVAHELFQNLTFVALFAGGGVALIRSGKNLEKRRLAARAAQTAQGLLPPSALPVEAQVLRAARAQAGRITPAEVAALTALPYDEAKAELERLTAAGACQVVVGDGGLVVYRFPEFEGGDAKREAS